MAGQYTSGTVTIPGLSGSDTDFNAMIDQLYEVEALHANQLIKWKNDWQKRKEAFTEIRTSLVSLQSTLKKINSIGKFLSKTSTSSAPQVATATLSEKAEARSYTIFVDQLAQAGALSYKTAANISAKDKIGSNGKFSFSTDEMETITLDIGSEMTLEGLVAMINGHSKNKSVTASLINTGSGQMLQLRSKTSGATSNVHVETQGLEPVFADGEWGALATPNSGIEIIEGKNARFFLDGSSTAIEYSSNIVKDVVPGITFNLFGLSKAPVDNEGVAVGAANGPATITVSLDKAAIRENVQTFVDAVNKVRTLLNELTAVDTSKSLTSPEFSESQLENQYGSVLTGNYGIQMIASKLKNITASKGIGFGSMDDTFSALSHIGIMTNANQGSDNYGLLEINEVHSDDNPYGTLSFGEALDADPEAIARLFAASITNDGYAWGNTPVGYNGCLPGTTKAGTYEVQYTVTDDGAGNITVTGTINGQLATYNAEEGILTSREGPSGGIALILYDLSPGPHDAMVSIREGKINELLRAIQGDGTQKNSGMLDKQFGSLSILEDNYTTIMGNINDKIIKENERLVVWERRMRTRFARLEATLSTYNNISKSLESQIKGLSSGNSS